jgi:cbb3-type cytochrome oxidase maturation protein
MEVIYLLIPGMIFLGLVMVGILVWAIKNGQYEDMEGDANRILMDDDDPLLPENSNTASRTTKESGKNWPDSEN